LAGAKKTIGIICGGGRGRRKKKGRGNGQGANKKNKRGRDTRWARATRKMKENEGRKERKETGIHPDMVS